MAVAVVMAWYSRLPPRPQVLRDMLRSMLRDFDQHAGAWATAVAVLAEVDCLLSLLAVKRGLAAPVCRPQFTAEPGVLRVAALRHPCLVNSGWVRRPSVGSLGGA